LEHAARVHCTTQLAVADDPLLEWTRLIIRLHRDLSACTHTHTRLTALCPGLPGSASTRKVKPIWILLEQETVSGSGISWAICRSAPCSRQITTPAPHRSVFLQAGCPSLRPTNSVKELKACNEAKYRPDQCFCLCLPSPIIMDLAVAEWLACWTQDAVGPGLKSQPRRCRVTVLGKLFTHQSCLCSPRSETVAALLRVTGVTAGLAESNGSLPPD